MSMATLTARQLQVYGLLRRRPDCAGLSAAAFVAEWFGISRAAAQGHLDRLRLKGLWGEPLPAPPPDGGAQLLRDCANLIRARPVCTCRERDERDRMLGRIESALWES